MGIRFPAWARLQGGYRFNFRALSPTMRVAMCFFLLTLAGCQYQAVSAVRMQIHQSGLNKEGLSDLFVSPELNMTCAVPNQWDKLHERRNIFYTHQQWRSRDRHAGMGVAYVRTPVSMSPETFIWFVKAKYLGQTRSENGRLLAAWSDSLSRSWFEAENDEYHVRGYAMTRGCDAWIVYSGYRVKTPPPEDEIALGAKAAQSVAPLAAPN